jgi:hypothetical protein
VVELKNKLLKLSEPKDDPYSYNDQSHELVSTYLEKIEDMND